MLQHTTRSFIPQLPPEIVDEVIDKLSDDITALKTCTTVCRTWISRSRFHLFSTLRVGGPAEAFIAFAAFLQTTNHASYTAVNGAHDMPCTGLSMVRTLYLDGKGGGPGHKPLLTLGTLQAIIHSLPNLNALHLNALRVSDSDFVPSKPRPLKVLHVVLVDASNLSSAGSELLAVLSLFSRIDSLFLRFVHFNVFPATHADAVVHPSLQVGQHPFPKKLEVCHLRLHLPRHTAFFLELVRRTPTRHSLKSLTVTCRTTEKFEAISAFCRDADLGRSLERLEIDLKYCIPQNATDINLLTTISFLEALREITLSGLCLTLNTIGVDFDIFGIILPLVSSAPSSTSLFTIVLLLMEPPEAACHIFERDAEDPHTVSPWERLEEAALDRGKLHAIAANAGLSSPIKSYEGSMALNIVFRSPFFAMGTADHFTGRIEDCIKQEMSTLTGRGLVTVRFEEDYSF